MKQDDQDLNTCTGSGLGLTPRVHRLKVGIDPNSYTDGAPRSKHLPLNKYATSTYAI
jgi:hypothetical protein